jgi:hypothetical protein
MTSGRPQDQRDRRWPAADSDDTGRTTRSRGRLATDTGPQTPIRSDGSEFGMAHPSGPLPVGPMPQPRSRLGRGRLRDDGTDPFGSSEADYDWLRYLGEAGPAQGTARSRPADTMRQDRAPLADRQHRAPLADGSSVADRPDAAPRPSRRDADRRAGEVSSPADSGPRHGAAPDPATDYLPRSHRRQPGPSRREAARAPWAAERGWPTSPTAPPPQWDADALTGPSGPFARPSGQPTDRSFAPSAEPASGWSVAPPAERLHARPTERSFAPLTEQRTEGSSGRPAERTAEQPFGRPTERPSGPTARPDERRVRGTGHPGHRRSAGAVDTGPETARSPIEQGKPRLRQRLEADRRVSAPELDTPTGPVRTMTRDTVGTAPTTTQPAQPTMRAARAKARRRHRTLLRVIGLVSAVAVVPATAAVVMRSGLLRSSGPDHTISVPASLLGYTLEPTLAKGMNAEALRADIVRKGNGEASHVVDGVYEDNAVSGTKSSPRIILFIGGNLSGSASSFIASFTGMLPGAFATSAGKLGGQAACVPGTSGRPAECAWADDDTFGLFASPALSASALGKDMRAMRSLIEQRPKHG